MIISKTKIALTLLFATITLSACTGASIPIQYAPQTTAELQGSVTVNKFSYLKAHATDDDEIGCNKVVCFHLTEPVSDFFTGAVKRELKQAGVTLVGPKCTLTGDIFELSISTRFLSVDYKSDVRFILSDSKGNALFDNDYVVSFNGNGAPVANGISKITSDTIDRLLKDPDFATNINKSCR